MSIELEYAGQHRRRLALSQKVVALVGKIERRLELCDQIEHVGIDGRQAGAQRAVQLIERQPRLGRRGRVDEVRDRLGLDQLPLAVHDGPQCELAAARQPGTGGDSALNHAREDERVAVGADLHHVLPGIGPRTGKEHCDGLVAVDVASLTPSTVDTTEGGHARLERDAAEERAAT